MISELVRTMKTVCVVNVHFSLTSMDTNPSDGVYVNGIFIDGARWDRNRDALSEQRPKVLIEGMPAIHLLVNFSFQSS